MNDNLLDKISQDPWGPESPAVKAVNAFRQVIAGHLAEMFLDGKADEVRTWARGIAHELKFAGVDIDDDIVNRIRDLALAPDDVPF